MGVETRLLTSFNEVAILGMLNTCYGQWGESREFSWAFRRACGLRTADLFGGFVDGELGAVSALYYRRVVTPDGRILTLAISGSSCTLPQFRRYGLFTSFVDATQSRAHELGIDLFSGFVLKSNSTYRTLASRGFIDVPALYGACIPSQAIAEHANTFSFMKLPPDEGKYALFHTRTSAAPRVWRFDYSLDEWWNQFGDRPQPTEMYRVSRNDKTIGYFLVEVWPGKLRLLEMSPLMLGAWDGLAEAVLAFAQRLDTTVEWYTTDSSLGASLRSLPGNVQEGSFMVTPLKAGMPSQRPLLLEQWFLQSGDRI